MVSKEGGVFAGEGLLETPMAIFLVQVRGDLWRGWAGADTKEIRGSDAVWVSLQVCLCARWAEGLFPMSDGCYDGTGSTHILSIYLATDSHNPPPPSLRSFPSPLSHQAILVILLTRLLAMGLHHVGQPRVIAEVLGGIILGPSVFGHRK